MNIEQFSRSVCNAVRGDFRILKLDCYTVLEMIKRKQTDDTVHLIAIRLISAVTATYFVVSAIKSVFSLNSPSTKVKDTLASVAVCFFIHHLVFKL